MTEEGVNALSIAEIARRLGVQPPSIYKYFASLMAIFDALFQRGQVEHLDVMREAMADAEPGLPAFTAGLEASGRWCLAHRALAQLMFWRPVPSFEPSPEAFAPSVEMVDLQRAAMADAVAAGQLGPDGRRRGGLPRLHPHRRRAQSGHGQRTRARLGPRALHAAVRSTHRAASHPLSTRHITAVSGTVP